jgi:5-formyltetrahydrofolate cyclo-ligase
MTPGGSDPIPVDFSESDADSAAIAREKTALRARAREGVTRLSPEERARASARVCGLVEGLPEYAAARSVAAYCALPDEIDLHELMERALGAGRDVLVPLTDRGARRIGFVSIADPRRDLREGAYGILEPRRGMPLADLSHLDLVLVPGRAFDARGGRLGRGGGYYDGFLSRLAPRASGGALKLGVGFACQLVERVPMEVRDVRLDRVVTDAGFAGT